MPRRADCQHDYVQVLPAALHLHLQRCVVSNRTAHHKYPAVYTIFYLSAASAASQPRPVVGINIVVPWVSNSCKLGQNAVQAIYEADHFLHLMLPQTKLDGPIRAYQLEAQLLAGMLARVLP